MLTVMLASALPLFSGEYTSVPLGHPAYQLLESAQIRGLIAPLPTAKPYSRHTVTEALKKIGNSQRLSSVERRVVEKQIRELSGSSQGSVLTDGALYHSSEHLDAAMGASVASETSAGLSFVPQDVSSTNFLNLYLSGDFKQEKPVVSYRFDMGFGTVGVFEHSGAVSRLEHKTASSYAPYTFRKVWEGYTYSLLDPFDFDSGASQDMELDIAFSMDPEVALGLFDEHVRISFSRIPRNWGLGEDSLMLSGSANPFVSASLEAKIFEWMDYAFLFGSLENLGDSGTPAKTHQALITLHSVDVRPFDWLYIGVHEGVVWPKRFELGYLNPLIFSSLYQGMIGDFDNILGGLSLGFSIPGYAEVYGTFFFDEFRPSSFADLRDRVRNFFSYKAGVQVQLPSVPFGTLRAQYTKIEPFTYTHPVTDVPWLDEPVHESFVTNGDGLVSKLDPNSDELLVSAKAFVSPSIQIRASYQMIRHGEYGGDYNKPLKEYGNETGNSILPDGMNYADQFDGNDSPDVEGIEGLRKDFLRDGDYDWYHIFAFGGSYDLRQSTNLPVSVKLTNSVVYHFKTDEYVQRIEGESTGWTNYLTVAFQLWGE
jgi:hypothetical protein